MQKRLSFAEGFHKIIEPVALDFRTYNGRNFLNLSSVERVRADRLRIIGTNPSDFFDLRKGLCRNIVFNGQKLSVSVISGQPVSNPRLHGSTLRVGSGGFARLASGKPGRPLGGR